MISLSQKKHYLKLKVFTTSVFIKNFFLNFISSSRENWEKFSAPGGYLQFHRNRGRKIRAWVPYTWQTNAVVLVIFFAMKEKYLNFVPVRNFNYLGLFSSYYRFIETIKSYSCIRFLRITTISKHQLFHQIERSQNLNTLYHFYINDSINDSKKMFLHNQQKNITN